MNRVKIEGGKKERLGGAKEGKGIKEATDLEREV